MKQQGLIFVISGPSGSGKTTLLERLLQERELKKRLVKSLSFTSRPIRSGEKNKRDYFFITEREFKQRLAAKKILEWTKYLGYYYATPRDLLERELRSGKHILMCLDFKGTLKIKRLYPKDTVTIFIMPPSLASLRKRIEQRCNRTKPGEIRQRLKIAREELSACARYDYCLLNKNLPKALKELKAIILREINFKL